MSLIWFYITFLLNVWSSPLMESDSRLFVTVPSRTDQISHLVSAAAFWEEQWRALSQANQEHGRAIDRFLTQTVEEIRQMGDPETLIQAEQLFTNQLGVLNGSFTEQKGLYQREAGQYIALSKRLKKNKEDPSLRGLSADLEEARTRLDHLAELVAKSKQDYKATLRQIQTDRKKKAPDTDTKKKAKGTGSQSDILREKADSQLDTYRTYMGEWGSQMEKVKALSTEYEESFAANETSRASVVMETLQKVASLPSNGKGINEDPHFDHIDTAKIIRVKMIKKEAITKEQFEDLTALDQGPRDVCQGSRAIPETRGTTESDDNEDGQEVYNRLKKMKYLRIVVKDYKRQDTTQLSLKVGTYVRQLQPADDDGLAYGALVNQKTGKRRKKRGFYPAKYLVGVTKEDLEKAFGNAGEGKRESRNKLEPTKKQIKPIGKETDPNSPLSITKSRNGSDSPEVSVLKPKALKSEDKQGTAKGSTSGETKCAQKKTNLFSCFGKPSLIQTLRLKLKKKQASVAVKTKTTAEDTTGVTYTPVQFLAKGKELSADSEDEVVKVTAHCQKKRKHTKKKVVDDNDNHDDVAIKQGQNLKKIRGNDSNSSVTSVSADGQRDGTQYLARGIEPNSGSDEEVARITAHLPKKKKEEKRKP